MSEPSLRCPTAPTQPDGTPHTIVGCGSANVEGPDHEGLYDCLDCGIWFNPADEQPVDGLTDPCPAPGYRLHTAVGAGAISSPYLCHGCGAWFTLPETRVLPPAECRACRIQACEIEGNTAEPHTCVPEASR